MKFVLAHTNINVTDLDRSIAFYKQALNIEPVRTIEGPNGAFKLTFLGDGETSHAIELTWLRDHPEPYDLGENENHICFTVDDFNAAYALHQKMGCICFENTAMGIYFIEDPDGYWLEIVPKR